MNKNTYYTSFIKRVTRKFLKFHVVVLQNNGKEMYKKLCCTCKVAFVLIRPIFHRSWCLRRLALHDFIFCLSKLEILSRDSLLALAKSVY